MPTSLVACAALGDALWRLIPPRSTRDRRFLPIEGGPPIGDRGTFDGAGTRGALQGDAARPREVLVTTSPIRANAVLVRAMKAGAVEFLTKPFDDLALLETVRDAVQRSAAALRQVEELQALRERHASLSTREREGMALVVAGLMNKQVGGELGISEITVKAHRGKVMRKMSVRSFADLVNVAAKLDIVSRN